MGSRAAAQSGSIVVLAAIGVIIAALPALWGFLPALHGLAGGAAAPPPPLYDLVVGLTHHKTGTFQLRCLFDAWAGAAGLRNASDVCFRRHSAGPEHMAACLEDRAAAGARLPALFTSAHGISQRCVDPGAPPGSAAAAGTPCLSFMLPTSRCTAPSASLMMLPFSQCTLDFPPPEKNVSLGVVHVIRNPIDAVLSAFLFHSSRPPANAEPWLYAAQSPPDWLATKLRWAGADEATIGSFGIPAAAGGEESSFLAALLRLPPERAVLLEFYHSLPELLSGGRQHAALTHRPGAVQIRFEALRDSFNATVAGALDALQLGLDAQTGLEAAVRGDCNPGTWMPGRRLADPHITVGKRERARAAAEAALMAHEPARRALCALAEGMGYEDRRCGGGGDGGEAVAPS